MSIKTVRVPSIYGPVGLDLLVCDAPECTLASQGATAVNWLQLSTIGMIIKTMQDNPDEMHFCSVECLRKAVAEL